MLNSNSLSKFVVKNKVLISFILLNSKTEAAAAAASVDIKTRTAWFSHNLWTPKTVILLNELQFSLK